MQAAKATKQDEFYTQLSDIEKELRHYTKHLKNKTVLCNCDDPRVSNFFKYFVNNFQKLGLKKLITTCYQNRQADLFSKNDSERGIYFEYSGEQAKSRLVTFLASEKAGWITGQVLRVDGGSKL
jgi:NAD(P)-dependent dehydrogenase (short-subunit alcohol dehydrogenase family)